MVRYGEVWYDQVRYGLVESGTAFGQDYGVVWLGAVRCGLAGLATAVKRVKVR